MEVDLYIFDCKCLYLLASSPVSSQFFNVACNVVLRATLKNWEEPGDKAIYLYGDVC